MHLHDTSGSTNGIEASATHLRIRRGARAIGLDGDLGSVQQIVVDQETGELRGIVVQRASDGAEFEIPVEVVTRATGGEVRFTLAQADLEQRPDLAHPYDPAQYIPVQPGDTAPRLHATHTARDTDYPVVTSVEHDAADLIAPPPVRPRTDAAVGQPGTPAMPPSSTLSTDDSAAATGEQGAGTLPRHAAARPDRGEPTSQAAPARAERDTPSSTGDPIGGRPLTGGGGEASTEPGATPSPQDTSAGNAAALGASPQAASAREDDLGDLSDDEFSNPDAALVNPHPGTEARIARPFNRATSSLDEPAHQSAVATDHDRAGMASAFRTATNISADDTFVVRGPEPLTPNLARRDVRDALTPPSAQPATAALVDTPPDATDRSTPPAGVTPAGVTPAGVSLASSEQDRDVIKSRARNATPFEVLLANPAETLAAWLQLAPVKIGLAAALVAGDIALRRLGVRHLRAFGRGALLGAALALVFAPMPGTSLRAQLAEATERIRARAA